ncbi:MAG: M14 family zinc carboxypeptidase [Anaerolineaceae bacterium]|nr:M14 family zinc carboxypeptidase [Anaerolineaceae bacterium]
MPNMHSHAQSDPPSQTGIPNFSCYRDAHSMLATMQFFAETYPDLVTLKEIGRSVQDQPIYVLEIGKKTNIGKPHLFLLSGLHGNDFSQTEISLRFAEKVLKAYGKDADLRWIADNVELDLIMIANPDGRAQAERQASALFAEPSDIHFFQNANNKDLEADFCFNHPNLQEICDAGTAEPETQAVLGYLTQKLGNPSNPATLAQASQNLFIYFSSHHKNSVSPALPGVPIGKIRIPWFYLNNPLPLAEEGLIWHGQLAEMLKVQSTDGKGSIAPMLQGDIKEKYPVDYIYQSYGMAALDLSAYPAKDNRPMECAIFEQNHPEYYLDLLVRAAKAAVNPFQAGYGQIVSSISQISWEAPAYKFQAIILEGNQIMDMPVENPIGLMRYWIDQPGPNQAVAITEWKRIDENPYTDKAEFSVPVENLTTDQQLLTVQACKKEDLCGIPFSIFIKLEKPPEPEATVTPESPPPKDIYLPWVVR